MAKLFANMILPLVPAGRRPPDYVFIVTFVLAFATYYSILFGVPAPPASVMPAALTAFRAPHARPPWLILTISAASHLQRRQIIRQTWQHLYKNDSMFDARFVISDPGPLWEQLVQRENETHGDLLMLPHEHETHRWANTVKTLETFKWLQRHGWNYTFVSKVDEDSFVDAKTFWRVWLEPRLRGAAGAAAVAGTYIGRHIQFGYPMSYGSGQFYTLSWDMLELATRLFRANHVEDDHEDVMIGRLMYEAQVPYNLTVLPLRVAFNYFEGMARGDGTAWAPYDQDVDGELFHALAPGAVNPHDLKADEDYLKVAACYDKDGLSVDFDVRWDDLMQTVSGWDEWRGRVGDHEPVLDI